ncbi:MAG: rhomboid family intramembrane serine protease [Flavobacteriales bacterium]|nr:rhomboid family intramembrane serine protease [Flavobacteriales bacterium]|tara:strand:- start:129 stop:746 length:618 start_codon:yes stop_codon:yes gene_type:complete
MNPYITYIIIGITALASYKAFQDGSLKWKLIFNAYQIKERKEWYRFFSHGLIHADWIHFGFNIYVLYVFGKSVELSFVSIFGPVRGLLNYILLYAGALLASSVYSFVKNQDNPHYNALGASGAVSAVLFSFIAMYPNSDLSLMFIPIPIKGWILGTLYLLYSHYMAKKEMDNIGHDAHFWGAVFGFVVTFVFEPKLFGAFISNFV